MALGAFFSRAPAARTGASMAPAHSDMCAASACDESAACAASSSARSWRSVAGACKQPQVRVRAHLCLESRARHVFAPHVLSVHPPVHAVDVGACARWRGVQILRPQAGEHFDDGLVVVHVLTEGLLMPEEAGVLDLRIAVS